MENIFAKRTPICKTTPLDRDENEKNIDQKLYQSVIGSLQYLITSRPDIIMSVCLCVRFQANIYKKENIIALSKQHQGLWTFLFNRMLFRISIL